MEAILHSVLLRQEQMMMQWDAEFEQQKQLFHINTSTLIDMLPIRPRTKRLKVAGQVQLGPMPSHDKENLVGFQGFLPNSACVKSPKARVLKPRGLAKRDLNTKFCDTNAKDVGRVHPRPAEAEPPRLQSAMLRGSDAENIQPNGRAARAIRRSNQVSLGVSVKIEVDGGDSCQMHVSPAIGEMPCSPSENRKRIRGELQGWDVALGVCNEENKMLSSNHEEGRMGADREAKVDPVEKNSKPKRARVVGEVKENAPEVENSVQTCRDTQIARSGEPEIAVKVEVEPEEQTCRDSQVVKAPEPEVASKGPSRRGRAKGASATTKAAVPDNVGKEPVRRGRGKKAPTASEAAVPEIAQRVTRSRARNVESVVKPETGTCEKLAASVVASKELVHQKEEVAAQAAPNADNSPARSGNSEPEPSDTAADRDAECKGRSANPIVKGIMEGSREPDVCAPAQEGVVRDEPSIKTAGESKERKSVARSRKKYPRNNSVATGEPGQLKVSAHADSQTDAALSHTGADEQSARIESRVAEILASVGNTSGKHLNDVEHGNRPEPQLEKIEEDVGQREVDFPSAEHPLLSRCEGIKIQDRGAPLASNEAPPAEEETVKRAHCSEAPERETMAEDISGDKSKEALRIELKVTADGRLASNDRARRPSAPQPLPLGDTSVLPLGGHSLPNSDATNSRKLSGALPTNTTVDYTTLLSEMIEGSILPLEKVRAPMSSPGSVVVARACKSSLRSGGSSSAGAAVELPDARRDGSASQYQVLPNAGMIRKPFVEDETVDGTGGSGGHLVEGSITLAFEGQGAESDNVLEECSIEANIQFAEKTWHTNGDSVQDAVVNTTSEGSRVKKPVNAKSMDGASMMDMSAREQVKSDAVSPVRYSEARAIEEAMRCSLEQEFHPDVTLTLNRWQFRRRLSPRSKARARRWRSDVATNGVDYGRASEAPVASPSRVVSSRDRSMEGTAYETFLEAQSPNLEGTLGGVETALGSGAEKAVDRADTTSWQEHASQAEETARRSIASLYNEVLSQALHDGEAGDNSVEYEVMETADEQKGNLSPLLRSIYKLSKACEKDMVGVGGILEEDEQLQIHSLIESAKKVVEQVSSKRAQASGALPITPGPDQPALRSSRFYDHTNLYPDRFRLFITPRASRAVPPTVALSAGIFPVSAAPAVASVLPGDMESTSPQTKHLPQETVEEAVSTAPDLDSALSESAAGADDVVSRARPRTPRSGEVPRTSDTGDTRHSGEGESAQDCSNEVASGSGRFTRTDRIHAHIASDVHPSSMVRGRSAICSASPLRGSHDNGALQPCDGSMLSVADRMGAVNTVELVVHESEVPLSSETAAGTEKLSELRSLFYALSKDFVAETSSTAKDVANVLRAESESWIKPSTNPPSLTPSLRFSPGYASGQGKGARVSAKMRRKSSKEVDLDAGENGEPAAVMEGETRIACSPISMGNWRGQAKVHQDFVTDNWSLSQHAVQKTVTIKEVVVLEGTSGPPEEAVARTLSMGAASADPTLRVEPQRPSNLVGADFGPVSSSSNLPRSNIITNLRSFVPLVQQQQPAAPYPNGKRDVKVKALEAAEAAKRLAEQKELEKQERKKAAEIAKREKQERAAQEKLTKQQEARAEKEKENQEASKRKAAAGGTTKSAMADSTNFQGTSSQNVLLKVKKTHELKLKMDQEKQERLQEEQRRKEEEWKKKEAENAARKRKHEAAEKKEREEKRRRQEEVLKAHREMEERQRLELEKKAQKQKALEEFEKERKAIEEELKRQKRLVKEREVEQRRKKEQEKEVAWLDQKEVTRRQKEEAAKLMKLLETEGRQQAVKMRQPSEDPAVPSTGPYHSFMASLHVAMGNGEGVGSAQFSGVNNLVVPQRISSQNLVGHPLRVPQQSGEGLGTAVLPCRNSQAAMRVPRTTPESGHDVSNIVGGSGKPLFRTPPEALGNSAVASLAVTTGGASSARELREAANVPQGQSGSRAGVPALAACSKPCQPGQVGFAGPPGGVVGHGDKGVQSYEISPYRDSEDEDSDEEEKRSQKPIPQWARKENMWPQLVRQLQQDPDDIFVGANSCSLDKVFEVKGSKKRPDFKRRGSSGDWVKDCLTWQEQMQYKVTMGYLR
ncbi:hypothetical protein KC19_6G058800 [Ceratodon purpureus]|uniref:Inner centromere protein ARK-binding domain-containing protein n=1 Tax=Ceratodon purpureus TaxID=3225 RepID=A0A8T0HCL3_CERPU|nr:hypothetical protein KC19_6G058800 [Ceratodon purpureus]